MLNEEDNQVQNKSHMFKDMYIVITGCTNHTSDIISGKKSINILAQLQMKY